MTASSIGALLCAVLALIVSGVELAGRFRIFPARAIFSLPGCAYISLNVLAALGVYGLANMLEWDFGWQGDPGVTPIVRGSAAGVATMALLRSSFFTFQQGETKVDIGPVALLIGMREVIDRHLSQQHAAHLLRSEMLKGLSFAEHHDAVTLLAQASAVNPDPNDAERLGDLAADLKANNALPDHVKMKTYAMRLAEIFGIHVVAQAAASLTDGTQPETDAEEGEHLDVEPPGSDSHGMRRRIYDQLDLIHQMLADLRADSAAQLPVDPYPGRFEVDLRLRRACLANLLDWRAGAWAFSDVPLQDAQCLMGAETLLDPSLKRVAERILPLLDWKPTEVKTHLVKGKPVGFRESGGRRPEWLISAALYELGIRLREPQVAIKVFDAAITLGPTWDAYVGRAAATLAAGNSQAAARDLGRALTARDPNWPVRPSSRHSWEGVLQTMSALLHAKHDPATERALWNSVVSGLTTADLTRRWTSNSRPLLSAAGRPSSLNTDAIQPLAALNELTSRVPPRQPAQILRAEHFLDLSQAEEPTEVLDEACRDEVRRLVSSASNPPFPAPSRPDESLQKQLGFVAVRVGNEERAAWF